MMTPKMIVSLNDFPSACKNQHDSPLGAVSGMRIRAALRRHPSGAGSLLPQIRSGPRASSHWPAGSRRDHSGRTRLPKPTRSDPRIIRPRMRTGPRYRGSLTHNASLLRQLLRERDSPGPGGKRSKKRGIPRETTCIGPLPRPACSPGNVRGRAITPRDGFGQKASGGKRGSRSGRFLSCANTPVLGLAGAVPSAGDGLRVGITTSAAAAPAPTMVTRVTSSRPSLRPRTSLSS